MNESRNMTISKGIPQNFVCEKTGKKEENIFHVINLNEIETISKMLESLRNLFAQKNYIMASKYELESFNPPRSKKIIEKILNIKFKKNLTVRERAEQEKRKVEKYKIGIMPHDISKEGSFEKIKKSACLIKGLKIIGKQKIEQRNINCFLSDEVGILVKIDKTKEKEPMPKEPKTHYNKKNFSSLNKKYYGVPHMV